MAQQKRGFNTAIAVSAIAIVIAAASLAVPFIPREQGSRASPQTREFYLVTPELDFNETTIGIPHYAFTPTQIIVNQGDSVVIHFYNTADDTHHTFTLLGYNIDVDLAPGQKQNVTFTATQTGVFAFNCKYHPTTMRGELIVTGA